MSQPKISREKALQRIKALLARGDSDFEEEARTSLHMAHKMMREHGITYADLGDSTSQPVALNDDELEAIAAYALQEHLSAIGQLGGKARAQALSRAELSKIGKAGVAARMKKVPQKKRSEIARKAAEARWNRGSRTGS